MDYQGFSAALRDQACWNDYNGPFYGNVFGPWLFVSGMFSHRYGKLSYEVTTCHIVLASLKLRKSGDSEGFCLLSPPREQLLSRGAAEKYCLVYNIDNG